MNQKTTENREREVVEKVKRYFCSNCHRQVEHAEQRSSECSEHKILTMQDCFELTADTPAISFTLDLFCTRFVEELLHDFMIMSYLKPNNLFLEDTEYTENQRNMVCCTEMTCD